MLVSLDRIRAALAVYYDEDIRPSLPEIKGKLYGFAVGAALAKPEAMIAKIAPTAKMMGIMDEAGNIEVDILAREAKKNLFDQDGRFRFELRLNPFNPNDVDVFVLRVADVDKLMDIINR